jgi:crotonobetainyl-CoA:carnitine CoA-transferase CaiB-like acyl-CoA transferase
MTSPLALAGLRVLDIASLYAAPLAATMLADFGAEVVKVEPPAGDGFRRTKMWPVVARGKRSIVLDLRSTEGCSVFKKLVATSDVVVENYPAKVLEARGIGWNELSTINPALIMLSVSCFGRTGPYADRPGSGSIGEGFAGLTYVSGQADGPPTLPGVALGDAVGAMNAVIGVMTALYARDRNGGIGQQVDVSLYEPILQIMGQAMHRWSPGNSPTRNGSKMPGGGLRNVYATRDGKYVVISASTERHERELIELTAGDVAGTDPDAQVAAWISNRMLADVVDELVKRRLPVTPVNNIDAQLADPHIVARGSLVRETDSELGDLVLAAPTPKLSATPGRIRSLGPELGIDTDAVLREWANIPQADAAALATTSLTRSPR